ncbi:MAG: hypothetical protein ACJ8CR_17530 [Roseiflexaceae bacterium]
MATWTTVAQRVVQRLNVQPGELVQVRDYAGRLEALVDEHVYGSLFIALGENRYMGGQKESSLNIDFSIPSGTLLVGGRAIVADGSVVV